MTWASGDSLNSANLNTQDITSLTASNISTSVLTVAGQAFEDTGLSASSLVASTATQITITTSGATTTFTTPGYSAQSIAGTADEITVTVSGATTTLSVPSGSGGAAKTADDEIITGAWTFNGSYTTFTNQIRVDEIRSNLVGPRNATLHASSDASDGFGFSAANTPMIMHSGITALDITSDRTITIPSGISMGGLGSVNPVVKLGSGTAANPAIQIGAGVANTGFRYNAGNSTLYTVAAGTDVLGCRAGTASIGDATANNSLEIFGTESAGTATVYLGGSSSALTMSYVQKGANGDLLLHVKTNAGNSADTTLAKLNHPSGASRTGFWLYDEVGDALLEVYVMANSTISTGFRGLAIADS